MRRSLALVLAAALPCALALPLSALGAEPEVLRESSGPRRAALNEMELKPLPAGLLEKLGPWNGEALTAASISGKPVLIVTWSSWSPASGRATALAQRMHDTFKDQGLIVLGAHHPQGWEGAAQFVKDRGLAFPVAHDAKGEFRAALKIDNDPEYYVVDRGGNLRFAGIAASSVATACEIVVKETREAAGDLPTRLRDEAKRRADEAARTGGIRDDADLAGLPPVPPGYTQPNAAAYKAADWPRIDPDRGKEVGLLDQNGAFQEKRLAFTPSAYAPATPNPQGRAIVVYVWSPDIRESYLNVIDRMDLLQRQHRRDLVVVGAMVPADRIRNQNNSQSGGADVLKQRWDTAIAARNLGHTLALDAAGSSLASLSGGQGGQVPIPLAMVVSSDGVIRWAGGVNTASFRSAIDGVLAADPGVRARREADRKFIESRK